MKEKDILKLLEKAKEVLEHKKISAEDKIKLLNRITGTYELLIINSMLMKNNADMIKERLSKIDSMLSTN